MWTPAIYVYIYPPTNQISPLFFLLIVALRHVLSLHYTTTALYCTLSLALSLSLPLPERPERREREIERREKVQTLEREREGIGGGDESIINEIMLRFRPIAPKPVTGGSVTGDFPAMNLSKKRTKRKYVRVSNSTRRRCYSKRNNNNRTSSSDEQQHERNDDKSIVTLQLLPEISPVDRTVDNTREVQRDSHTWLMTGGFDYRRLDRSRTTTVVLPGIRVVESWVTVECVTDTCTEVSHVRDAFGLGLGLGLGCTDFERRKNLEVDTCPGFISDGYNRVEWVNDAYKRMIIRQEGDSHDGGQSQSPSETVVAWLVIKDDEEKKLSPSFHMYPAAFTCRVRLQYATCRGKYSQTLPCDTWRMECGGFAWRLDVKAALSLGR